MTAGPSILVALLLAVAASAAHAHRGHDSQLVLSLQAERVQGGWSTNLHDLSALLPPGSEAADEAAVTRLIAATPELAAQLLRRLKIGADGAPCTIEPLRQEIAQRQGSAVWLMKFEARCPAAPARLSVDLRGLFQRDPKHLVVLKIEAGAWVRAALLTADSAYQTFQPDQTVRPPSTGNSTPVMKAASSLAR